MKKLTILFIAIVFPFILNAQSESINKIMQRYSGEEGVTIVNISPELFRIMEGLDVQQFESDQIPFNKLHEIKILSIENETLLSGKNFFEEVTSGLNTSEFIEVMSVKDGEEDVKMWLNTAGKQIHDFLLLVSSPGEGVIVYINGDFSMSDISGMAKSFGGLENLEELESLETLEEL